MSTEALGKYANSVGALGLEALPSRRLIREVKQGKLPRVGLIYSLHENWSVDRIQDEKLTPKKKAGALKRRAINLVKRSISATFPQESDSTPVLDRLGKEYDLQTVFHWPEHTKKYVKPTLEIHENIGKYSADDKPWTIDQIINWASEDPSRKLALDISVRKLIAYFQTQGITKLADIIDGMKRLLPYAGIIHFQVANKAEFTAVKTMNMDSDFAEMTRVAKKNAPNANFVIEIPYPTAFRAKPFRPKKYFQKAVAFIQKA